MQPKFVRALIGVVALGLIAGLLLIPAPAVATDEQRGPLVRDWPSPIVVNPPGGAATGISWLDITPGGKADYLAVSRANATDLIYRTSDSLPGAPLSLSNIFETPTASLTGRLEWSPAYNSTALLATPNPSGPFTVLRLNTTTGAVDTAWSEAAISATKAAWADFDADGLPDLLNDDFFPFAALYINQLDGSGPGFVDSGWAPSDTSNVTAIATGNVIGDASPDILLANENIRIYEGNSATAPYAATSTSRTLFNFGFVAAIELGDLDGDGNLDVVLATDSGVNLYGSRNNLDLSFASSDRSQVVSLALADYDNDGDLDIAYGTQTDAANRTGTIVLLRNDFDRNAPTELRFTAIWSSDGKTARDLAWGDADGDGAPELAVARAEGGFAVYRNISLINIELQVLFNGTPSSDALIFRRAAGAIGPLQPILGPDGRPILTDASGLLRTRSTLGLNDEVVAIWPATAPLEQTNDTDYPINTDGPNTIVSTITVSGAGVVQDVAIPEILGSHTWFGDLRITLISPSGTQAVLVEGVCDGAPGIQIGFNDNATQSAVTCPPNDGQIVAPVDPLSIFKGESANGDWKLVIDDLYRFDGGTLDRWTLKLRAPAYPLYYTNLPIDSDGFEFAQVDNLLEPIALSVGQSNPLVIFDLEVSLEWDAREDTAFMTQLRRDLERSAELLYDWTNGQVTLGAITINHDRLRWAESDVRIYASNRLRPNADKGGVVPNPVAELLPNGTPSGYIFRPGQVRIGAVWNRYGEAEGIAGEDWPRALAHELGHYLLFLDDNYIGFEQVGDRTILVPVENCIGAMNNPYREDESEFHPGSIADPTSTWAENCRNTLSQSYSGRSDWAAITNYYPQLKAPATIFANSGPNYLPLAIVRFIERAPSSEPDIVSQQIFSLIEETATGPQRLQPESTARAYIFQDYNGINGTTRLIELGRPTTDQLTVRGLSPGDRLCFFEPDAERLGCDDNISDTDTTLSVHHIDGWKPDVRLSPVDQRTIRVQVPLESLGSNAPTSLEVQLFPGDQAPSDVVTLDLTGDVFSGTIGLADDNGKIEQALVVVREPDNVNPRREMIVDYALYGIPVELNASARLASGGELAQSDGCSRPRCAPASLDGHATIYTIGPDPALLYSFQKAGDLPDAPAWSVPVGLGYWVQTADGSDAAIANSSINIGYSDTDLPDGSEGGLAIYHWQENSAGTGIWQRLESTRVDGVRNELTANAAGPGLYVLMTSLAPREGWNLLSYAWNGADPEDALGELNATPGQEYSTVYGYEDGVGWQVYADGIEDRFEELVNTLTTMAYGRGYWVNVLNAGGAADTAAEAEAALAAGIPLPPATFYGEVPAAEGFTPQAGITVEARVNGVLCGTGTTVALDGGGFGYRVSVEANQPGATNCGTAGQLVELQAAGQHQATYAAWSSEAPRHVDLSGGTQIFLPLAPNRLVLLSSCLVNTCP